MSRSTRVKIVVDGMTGVGKTSLVNILSEELQLTPFQEIFEDKNKLLYKFFNDRHKWAFPMQVNFLTNRFQQYIEASSIGDAIMDRSIYSDNIFARMYLEEGYLTPEEYDVYKNLLQTLLEQISPPALMVYLKVSSEEAVRRIHSRGRTEELKVEDKYWIKLNEFYDEHYKNYRGKLLSLDVNKLDFVHNENEREYVLHQIFNFLDNK